MEITKIIGIAFVAVFVTSFGYNAGLAERKIFSFISQKGLF